MNTTTAFPLDYERRERVHGDKEHSGLPFTPAGDNTKIQEDPHTKKQEPDDHDRKSKRMHECTHTQKAANCLSRNDLIQSPVPPTSRKIE